MGIGSLSLRPALFLSLPFLPPLSLSPCQMPTILNGGMASSPKLEDSQLAELSAQARKAPAFQGYLTKLEGGGKSSKKVTASKKWCLLHRNFLFYYDIETSSRPTGALLVENCTAGPIAVVDTLLPDYFPQDREVSKIIELCVYIIASSLFLYLCFSANIIIVMK